MDCKPNICVQLDCQNVYKKFSLNLKAELPGQGITCIFGPSGSGKTTFLRCMAGLEKSHGGYVQVNGKVWQTKNYFLPSHKRNLAYVFQESSLLPHLSARKNIEYALKRCKIKPDKAQFDLILSLTGIEKYLSKFPHQLSGGERQRVAIARALLIQPELLLMDEPLASLDDPRKRDILPLIENLRDTFNIPILYVSHSVNEVIRLANHIVVLHEGNLLTQGTFTDVFCKGSVEWLREEEQAAYIEGKVIEHDDEWNLTRIEINGESLWVRDLEKDNIGSFVRLRILASDVSLSLSQNRDSSVLNQLPAVIEGIQTADDNAMALLQLNVGTYRLFAQITRKSISHLGLAPKVNVWALVKSAAIVR